MASAAESYQSVVSPINTGSSSSRPGGDKIAISFTKGKKSTQEQLDELAIKKAEDDLARLALIPVESDQERYSWEVENQRLAEEAAARAAEEDSRQAEADALALQASSLALEQSRLSNPLDIEARTQALESESQAMQQAAALAPYTLQSAQLGNESAASALAQSKITNPLDVQAKQLGITGAQQAIDLANKEQAAKDQAYRDAHLGMTPDQWNASRDSVNKYNSLTNYAPIGSAAQKSYTYATGLKTPTNSVVVQPASSPNTGQTALITNKGGGLSSAVALPNYSDPWASSLAKYNPYKYGTSKSYSI